MDLWHVTWATEGRNPLFPDEGARLRAVAALVEAAAGDLALFCVVDEHVHAVLCGGRALAARRVRAITRRLRGLAVAPVDAARWKPIQDRRHMETVRDYVLRQPSHHGLPGPAALHSGSCCPDLLGARRLPGPVLCVTRALPRFRPVDALGAVGLGWAALAPAGPDALRAVGARRLVAAAAAAVGADPALGGKDPGVVLARRAAAVLARQGGLPLGEVAWALHAAPCSVRRLAVQPIDPAITAAVRLRLALEDRVAATERTKTRTPPEER